MVKSFKHQLLLRARIVRNGLMHAGGWVSAYSGLLSKRSLQKLLTVLVSCLWFITAPVIAIADHPNTRSNINIGAASISLSPYAYTSIDNDYLSAIRVKREIERESGSRSLYLYQPDQVKLPADFDQKSILTKAWRGTYQNIIDSDNDGLCETYDGSDRTLRELSTKQKSLVKRFDSTREAAEFITDVIIREYDEEPIGETDSCQFKNPGEVTQFLAYFDLTWLIGYNKARQTSLQTRNLIEWIPAKVLSTYQKKASDNTPMCELVDRQRHAHMYMLSHYLWRARVPMRADYSWSDSVDDLVQQLRYKDYDSWSHTVAASNYAEQENRLSPDNGLWLGVPDEEHNRQLVMLVEPGSAAEKAGLSRGDTVVAVNQYTPKQLTSRALRRSLREEMARQGQGQYKIIKQGMTQSETLDISFQNQVRNTVHSHSIVDVAGGKAGYLNIKEFQPFTRDELNNIFTEFKQAGVSELILDLRYNIGGDTFSSAHLASLILNKDDEIYSRSRLADPAWSMTVQYMDGAANALDLKQVVALTSDMTASAAEQLLNALRPHIDVVTVGSKTYGKPVTMAGYPVCDELVFAVTAISLNSENQHVPFNGIEPTCPVADNLNTDPNSPFNPPLQTAMRYLNTGSCN